MKLTKRQIKELERLLDKAEAAESKARSAEGSLCSAIISFTGVSGNVDQFPDDGFGFTPDSSGDTHVHIQTIISAAKMGVDIDEKFISSNLSF